MKPLKQARREKVLEKRENEVNLKLLSPTIVVGSHKDRNSKISSQVNCGNPTRIGQKYEVSVY